VAHRRELAIDMGAAMMLDPLATIGGIGAEIKRARGRGADIAIETSGSYRALHDAIAAVGIGGRVVSVGFYQGEATGLKLGEEWHHNRPDLISSMGVWGCPHRSHPLWDRQRLTDQVRDLLYEGKIPTARLLTHTVEFADAQRGYDLIMQHPEAVLKVALAYDAYSSNPARGC
jgi:threonine dehydrogenase-like Zn-dependent dehydrogenase